METEAAQGVESTNRHIQTWQWIMALAQQANTVSWDTGDQSIGHISELCKVSVSLMWWLSPGELGGYILYPVVTKDQVSETAKVGQLWGDGDDEVPTQIKHLQTASDQRKVFFFTLGVTGNIAKWTYRCRILNWTSFLQPTNNPVDYIMHNVQRSRMAKQFESKSRRSMLKFQGSKIPEDQMYWTEWSVCFWRTAAISLHTCTYYTLEHLQNTCQLSLIKLTTEEREEIEGELRIEQCLTIYVNGRDTEWREEMIVKELWL